MDINDRIIALIEGLHISQNAFSKLLGTSSSRISNITTKRNKPDSEILAKIPEVFRNVNTYWLLTGKGKMFLDKEPLDDNSKTANILSEIETLADEFRNNPEKGQQLAESLVEFEGNLDSFPWTTNSHVGKVIIKSLQAQLLNLEYERFQIYIYILDSIWDKRRGKKITREQLLDEFKSHFIISKLLIRKIIDEERVKRAVDMYLDLKGIS